MIKQGAALIALTVDGGLKAMPANTYAGDSNAGRVRADERLLDVRRGQTTDYLLCLLSSGRVEAVPVANLPETTRAGRADLAQNFLSLYPGERLVAIAPRERFP
jgi:DNA gyrase subunit A